MEAEAETMDNCGSSAFLCIFVIDILACMGYTNIASRGVAQLG